MDAQFLPLRSGFLCICLFFPMFFCLRMEPQAASLAQLASADCEAMVWFSFRDGWNRQSYIDAVSFCVKRHMKLLGHDRFGSGDLGLQEIQDPRKFQQPLILKVFVKEPFFNQQFAPYNTRSTIFISVPTAEARALRGLLPRRGEPHCEP